MVKRGYAQGEAHSQEEEAESLDLQVPQHAAIQSL